MFIPIGGLFIFGGDNSRSSIKGKIVMNVFNILMGGLALLFGYMYGLIFLQVIGYIIGGLGLITVIFNLFALRNADRDTPAKQVDEKPEPSFSFDKQA